MDLRGYGPTREKALRDLSDLVDMQVSFAALKGQREMIWRDADPVWFGRFEAARRETLRARLRDYIAKRDRDESPEIASLPLPHVIDEISRSFRADGQTA